MPAQFTLPPDTRAVGTGNPPADMNGVTDALTASGAGLNVLNAAFAGGADPTGAADSSAAFQACVTAAVATGAEMVVPAGTYSLLSGIAIAGPLRMRGLGACLSNTSGLFLTAAVTLNGPTGSSNMFTFPYQGYLWGGLEIQGFNINYTGTGDVFHQVNFTDFVFRDLQITITGSAAMAFQTSGTNSLLSGLFERVNITTTNATRSNPMMSIVSANSGAISNNTHFKCKFTNAGFDNTQYMVFYSCTTAGNGFHYADNMRECWFEHPYGGAYKSLSGLGIVVDGCSVWDAFSGSGGTTAHSFYYFGAAAGNAGSTGTTITGCSRNRNGPNGSTCWDAEFESTSSQTLIQNYCVKPDTASTYTPAYFNLGGHNDVTLIGNQSPQGSAVNGNSNTVITNPSPAQTTITQGVLTPLPAGWGATDSSYLEWNYDPRSVNAGSTLTNNAVTLIRVNVRAARSVTNVTVFQVAAGTSLTTSQNLAGLISSTGTVIGTSADQTTTWGSGTNTIRTIALTGGPFTVSPPFVWVALVSNGTGTPVSFGRDNNFNATAANLGATTVGARWATNGTATTAFSSITPSSNVIAQATWWAALS